MKIKDVIKEQRRRIDSILIQATGKTGYNLELLKIELGCQGMVIKTGNLEEDIGDMGIAGIDMKDYSRIEPLVEEKN